MHHLQNVFINNFYDSEALGVNCTPKCGGCKCGHCTIGSKSYSLKKGRKLKLIEDGLKSEQDCCIATYLWIKEPNQSKQKRSAAYQILLGTKRHLSKNPTQTKVYCEQIIDMIN